MLIGHLERKLDRISDLNLTRSLRIAETPTNARQTLLSSDGKSKRMLMFCSNDYLGLASHPEISKALQRGVVRWGGGSGASHLISGHTRAHQELDRRISHWYSEYIENAQALSFSTGYMANLALTTALGDEETEFFSDELNHASLIDGMRLAKANVIRYPHNDTEALRSKLESSKAKVKLIASDTVFSMDGDLARLPELLLLAEEFDAWVILDDAHGFGVLGERGRGALEHFQLRSQRVILMGTLGKAAGLSGAFVVANSTIIEYLLQAARTYIFTTAALPAVCDALQTSLSLIEDSIGSERRTNLAANQQQFRLGVQSILQSHPNLTWRLTDSMTPIQPLVVGENLPTMLLAGQLEDKALRVPGIRPPSVPIGQARLRITLCASHSFDDVESLLTALDEFASGAPT